MIVLKKQPFKWVSAHRAINFEFDYQAIAMLIASSTDSTVTSNRALWGKMSLSVIDFYVDTPVVGGLIFITEGEYMGYHKIAEVYFPGGSFTGIITQTNFTVEQFTGDVKLITEHVFKITKGYAGPPMKEFFPLGDVATFKPEPNKDGVLKFNISGYVNKIFDVLNSNLTGRINNLTVYYNLYNRIFLRDISPVLAGSYPVTNIPLFVLNASIDMYDLNTNYVGTGRHLNSGNLGNYYKSCGISHNILVDTQFVFDDKVYDQGEASSLLSYDNSFDNSFSKAQ